MRGVRYVCEFVSPTKLDRHIRYMRDFEREMQVGPSSVPSVPLVSGMGRFPSGPSAELKQQSQSPDAVPPSWSRGPRNPEGILCGLSDRPSLCAAANWERNEVVVVRMIVSASCACDRVEGVT